MKKYKICTDSHATLKTMASPSLQSAENDLMKAISGAQKKFENIFRPPTANILSKKLRLDSPRLTYVYGGGVAIGKFHRFIGPESGGKSTICTYIAAQFQKYLSEQFPELKEHKIVVYLDFERSFDPEHAVENGLDITSVINEDGSINKEGKFLLMHPDSLEDAAIVLEDLIKTNTVSVVIFDSESMASTRTVMADEMGKPNFGSAAKAMKEFCNRFTVLCSNYNTTMFIISQERAQMQMMSHAIATTGGFALKYAAATTNRVRKIENIVRGNEVAGIHLAVKNYKNKTSIPFRECEMDLYYKGGFNADCEYIDFLKDLCPNNPDLSELCEAKAGGFFKSEKYGWSYRGKESFQEAVNNGLEGWQEIKNKVQDILSNKMDSDAEQTDVELENDEHDDKD